MSGLLEGKRAVVTGARGGIGKAILQSFVEEGAEAWACVRSANSAFLEYVDDLILSHSAKVHILEFDLLDDSAVKAAAKCLRHDAKNINILVNCAGVFPKSNSFSMTSMNEIIDTINANLIGSMRFTQYLLRFIDNGSSIINLSSIAAKGVSPGQYAYSCSKAAINVWTKMLADELGAKDIRVNAIAPGIIDTAMTEMINPMAKQEKINETALKRIGLPIEVASVAVFLASSLSSYISGQIIEVNG